MKSWKTEEIEKIKGLKDYIQYLRDIETQEDDGTSEGREIMKAHYFYQDKIEAIIDEIISCYELYNDYEEFDDEEKKEEFKNKFMVVSHILLASNEVKMEDLEDE